MLPRTEWIFWLCKRQEGSLAPILSRYLTPTLCYTNGGMGFVVGKRLLPYLRTSRVISDRIAVVSFRFGKPDPPISVVIAYGHTNPRCTANPQLREEIYQQLQAAVDTIPKRDVTVLMGDMNANVGKCCNIDTYSCLEAWSKGHRNDNGEAFLEFCEQSDLVITNSLFNMPHDISQPGKATSEGQMNLFPYTIKSTTSQYLRDIRHW